VLDHSSYVEMQRCGTDEHEDVPYCRNLAFTCLERAPTNMLIFVRVNNQAEFSTLTVNVGSLEVA